MYLKISVILFLALHFNGCGETTQSTPNSNIDNTDTKEENVTSHTFSFNKSQTIKIMPLGDSITYDHNTKDNDDPRPTSERHGYRNYLWYALQDANYDVDFVGSVSAGEDIDPPFDPDNEGHPGWSSSELAEQGFGWFSSTIPDIILIHAGTNDRSTNPEGVISILDEVDAYETASGRKILAIVALIIDKKAPDAKIKTFNERLNILLQERIKTQKDYIIIVDMYNKAGLTSSDYADNTHPDNTGYQKMSSIWYNALVSVLPK